MNNGPDAAPVEERRRARTPGTRFRDCPECPEMVAAPAGSFMTGRHTDTRPRRSAKP